MNDNFKKMTSRIKHLSNKIDEDFAYLALQQIIDIMIKDESVKKAAKMNKEILCNVCQLKFKEAVVKVMKQNVDLFDLLLRYDFLCDAYVGDFCDEVYEKLREEKGDEK